MEDPSEPIEPDQAERRFAELLEEAGLPCFTSSVHDSATDQLEVSWDHGLTIHIDLTREMSPIEDWERASILGLAHICEDHEPIHVTVSGSVEDPRLPASSIAGVVIDRQPRLHPDDVTVHNGIPVTSPSRTLIDCAECMTAAELRATFAHARTIGLLDPEALHAARARVEWRPSLAMLDEVIDEFCN